MTVVGFERGEPVFGCVGSARTPVCVAAHGSSSAWFPARISFAPLVRQLCRQQHLNRNDCSVCHDSVRTPPGLTETFRSVLTTFPPTVFSPRLLL